MTEKLLLSLEKSEGKGEGKGIEGKDSSGGQRRKRITPEEIDSYRSDPTIGTLNFSPPDDRRIPYF